MTAVVPLSHDQVMTASIKVELTGNGEPQVFNVLVEDGGGRSRHRVTLSKSTYEKLTGGRFSHAQCVEAAFRFLLDREAKSEILPSFDVNVIHLYFPDFEEALPRYFA